jgi:hypothetical protein
MSESNVKQPTKKLALVRENVKKLGVRSGIQTGTAYHDLSPIIYGDKRPPPPPSGGTRDSGIVVFGAYRG